MGQKSEDSTRGPRADQASKGEDPPPPAAPDAPPERAPPTYALFDHTADLGFTLEAPDLPRLLARGALAIHDIGADAAAARPLEERAIAALGPDLESLFLAFLEEAHWLFEGERFLACEATPAAVERPAAPDEPWRARAILRGEPFDPARHALRRPIKAVTWHGLEVAETRARVILDL